MIANDYTVMNGAMNMLFSSIICCGDPLFVDMHQNACNQNVFIASRKLIKVQPMPGVIQY